MGKYTEPSPVEALDAVVRTFEQDKREPDRWESFCVMCALAHISRRDNQAASRQIAFAQLPHELRPPSQFRVIPATYELLSGSDLRIALDEVKAERAAKRQRPARRVLSRG